MEYTVGLHVQGVNSFPRVNNRTTKDGVATGTTIALIDSIVVFIVSLLIGALDIYIGARVIADREDCSCALITALIGAII